MLRWMLWAGVVIGAALMGWALTLPGPWVGLPVGVLLVAGSAVKLTDG
jgi:hypothetical protein